MRTCKEAWTELRETGLNANKCQVTTMWRSRIETEEHVEAGQRNLIEMVNEGKDLGVTMQG